MGKLVGFDVVLDFFLQNPGEQNQCQESIKGAVASYSAITTNLNKYDTKKKCCHYKRFWVLKLTKGLWENMKRSAHNMHSCLIFNEKTDHWYLMWAATFNFCINFLEQFVLTFLFLAYHRTSFACRGITIVPDSWDKNFVGQLSWHNLPPPFK